ncbi:Uncharacterized protein HZ326_18245 [Fusarium oxysporum f. sp. albedinis]|nr:Uncharacterized protein HZ326_18245 [Fusarium oxysporum f. sp. albedinis]
MVMVYNLLLADHTAAALNLKIQLNKWPQSTSIKKMFPPSLAGRMPSPSSPSQGDHHQGSNPKRPHQNKPRTLTSKEGK